MKRHAFVWALALALGLASPLFAGSMTLGGFDASRVFRPFSGPSYTNIRGRLSDTANFGPSGVVDHTIQFAPDTTTITPQYLSTVNMFVMTEVMGNLSSNEAQALADFVRGGGCLAIISDTLHVSMPYGQDGSLAGNSVLSLLGGGSIDSNDTIGIGGLMGPQTAHAGTLLSSPGSETLSGPFGTVNAGDTFGASWHNALTAGPHSHLLGNRAGTGILMEIAHDAVAPGSGHVLVAGDILFSNSFVPPGSASLQNENNAKLFMNFVAACDCGCHQVPEPASLVLVLSGAVVLGGLALARRRAA